MQNKLFLNKYQPIYFNEFQQNTEIIKILTSLINLNNLNILFIGDIGVGKTVYVNATVKEYYKDIPNDIYLDNILYLSSLKDQGIGFYRNDVKTFCQTRSSIPNKKKTIVIDDIDIINEQSQQVFRTYIDNYSSNINLICSCTNPQKVIEPLQSRLLIIKITPITQSHIYNIARNIIVNENIVINDESVDYIVNISNNNPKILINYMEKLKLLNKPINVQLVTDICTNVSYSIFKQYTIFIINKQLKEAINILYNLYDTGFSVMDILDLYFSYVKISDILSENQKYNIIPFICKFITAFYNITEDCIELAIFTNNLYKNIDKV